MFRACGTGVFNNLIKHCKFMKNSFMIPKCLYINQGKLLPICFLSKKLISSLILAIFCFSGLVSAQTDFCGFDETLQQSIAENPELQKVLDENEKRLQAFIKKYTKDPKHEVDKSIGNGVYEIPVVFHIIHTGTGSPSDIDPALCATALEELNNDFRDSMHTDVEIQFCLAKRDQFGNPSSGVTKHDGTGIGGYENVGINRLANGNEAAIKGLSVWPNTDFINIWVVNNIHGGNGITLGYATFPGSSAAIDGIVIRYDVLGSSIYSNALTHEAGHFFDLYHTFEGGSAGACPPNSDCNLQGDRICDTPPHKLVQGGCDTTNLNICDNNNSLDSVAHNHMNYTENDCRYEFTDSQAVRIRCALLTLRQPLTYSLGCASGCLTTTSSFTVDSTGVDTLTNVSFVSTSTGNAPLQYSWLIDGTEVGTSNVFQHVFGDPGQYEVCLDVTGSDGCIKRSCTTMTAFPVCAPSPNPCEKVLSGSFEQINSSTGSSNNFDPVCGWDKTESSPFYCNMPDNNSIGLIFTYTTTFDEERVTSEAPLDLKVGSDYIISFDYHVTNEVPEKLIVALTQTGTPGPLPSNANIIAEISRPDVNTTNQINHECHEVGAVFEHYDGGFTYSGDGKLYLNISGKTGFHYDTLTSQGQTVLILKRHESIVFFDNISIIGCETPDCTPIPEFEIKQDSCSATFSGYDVGGGGSFHWDFGDGDTETGQVVFHEFLYGDTFDVCLTITCEENEAISEMLCKEVIVPDSCNQCDTLSTPITAILCEEDTTTTNTFISNFSFSVPDGYGPCDEGGNLFITSKETGITILSYEIDTLPVGTDIITVAALMAPLSVFEFEKNGAFAVTTLCNDSMMICIEFEIAPTVCDDCHDPVETEAVCNDSLSSDSVFVYEGSVVVNIDGGNNVDFCGVFSPEIDFSITNIVQNVNDWTINYSITTTQSGYTGTTALLCFYHNIELIQICVPLNISVSCDILPQNCVATWGEKPDTCDFESQGNYVFNIPNMTVVGNGSYSLCDGGLFGTIDGGGTVVVNSANVSGLYLSFDITIVMPSATFVSGNGYELRLYLCDDQGNPVCYLMPYELFIGECGGGSGGEGMGRPNTGRIYSHFDILPNPASDKLIILTDGYGMETDREIKIMDLTGRIIGSSDVFEAKQEINITQFHTGIYFVAIMERGVPVKTEKVVILR